MKILNQNLSDYRKTTGCVESLSICVLSLLYRYFSSFAFSAFLIVANLLFFAQKGAGQEFFVSDEFGDLGKINFQTCAYEKISIANKIPLYDITFHPNGKLYGINDFVLYEVDTFNNGSIRPLYKIGLFSGCLTSDKNGLIYGAVDSLWSFDVNTNRIINYGRIYAEGKEVRASGDLTFYQGELYLVTTDNSIVKVNIPNPSKSKTIVRLQNIFDVWGIVTYKDCDVNKTYLSTAAKEIFELDWKNGTTKLICKVPERVYGAATATEFTASQPDTTIIEQITCDPDKAESSIKKLKNIYACDSIVKTQISYAGATFFRKKRICEGQSFSVGDTVYRTTGVYKKRFAQVNKCDSVVTTDLTVNLNKKIAQNLTICGGEAVSVGDTIYKTNGIFNKLLKTTEGCDSVITTNLAVKTAQTISQTKRICAGENVRVGDTTYQTTGQFTRKLQSINGCDSTVLTNLSVLPTYNRTQKISLCMGEQFTIGDTIYSTAGIYAKKFKSTEGCDSIITTDLKIYPVENTVQNVKLCEGKNWAVGDTVYRTAGTYKRRLKTTWNCDSFVTTTLNFIKEVQFAQKKTICAGESFRVGDTTYRTSGQYVKKLRSTEGCDSVVTTDLTVVDFSLITTPNDTIVRIGDSLLLRAEIDAPLTIRWRWTPNTKLSCDTCSETWVRPNQSLIYRVEAIDTASQCTQSASIAIRTKSGCPLYIPNTFSPNGDNLNDALTLHPSACVAKIRRFAIFNRWGNLVFEKKDITISNLDPIDLWDGSISGTPRLESEPYVYYLDAEYVDGKSEVIGGDFTVLR